MLLPLSTEVLGFGALLTLTLITGMCIDNANLKVIRIHTCGRSCTRGVLHDFNYTYKQTNKQVKQKYH